MYKVNVTFSLQRISLFFQSTIFSFYFLYTVARKIILVKNYSKKYTIDLFKLLRFRNLYALIIAD